MDDTRAELAGNRIPRKVVCMGVERSCWDGYPSRQPQRATIGRSVHIPGMIDGNLRLFHGIRVILNG
jgi:hypothetical protein